MSQISESLHYQGKIKLLYNETNPKLRYQVSHLLPDNKWSQPNVIAGVSSVLSLIPKPYLVAWAGLVATEKAIELLDERTISDVRTFTIQYMDKYGCTAYEAIKAARKQYPVLAKIATGHAAKGDEAKETGTDAHNALEAHILGNPYTCTTPGGAKALESFKKLGVTFGNPRTEMAIMSRQFNYAGRFDLLCEIGGKLVMCDFKTNKRDKRFNPSGAHMENFVQMAAYAWAWFEEHGEWPSDLAVINVDKENGDPAIITFASDFGTSPEELSSLFLSMKGVADSLRQFESRWSSERL